MDEIAHRHHGPNGSSRDDPTLVRPRRLDEGLGRVAADVADPKRRVASADRSLAGPPGRVTRSRGPRAGVATRLGRVDERLERIERRLDPWEAR